ncbi:MAG: glucose-6-phosphate dehydrogenase [Pirellulaceae bacterium]
MVHTIVIFGASGDLTSRKLIPALFSLHRKKYLPAGTRIVGVARTDYSHDQWRASLEETTKQHAADFDAADWNSFAPQIFYHPGDIGSPKDFVSLRRFLKELEGETESTRLYYLSTSPTLYASAIAGLGAAHSLPIDGDDRPLKGDLSRRIVIEKPFGTDLATAKQLNQQVHEVFDERQVYRIDHYLGKETVQNMLVLRFANSIFEPIWNRNYIDHVQITVAEEVKVGRRGGYYDKAGVLRDMFQNHLLQLLMITAMEAPVRFSADHVRDEKVKVLRAVRRAEQSDLETDTFRAQYDGYLQEEGVPGDSRTATFAALKLHVDNWRWNGVPFYLRSGKGLSCRTTQIVIQFRDPPHLLFTNRHDSPWDPNQLVIQIQPAEGIQLQFHTKVPDAGMKLQMANLDFQFAREFRGQLPDAYQRLLLDALNGDASLFARSDEVEQAWGIIDPITEYWSAKDSPQLRHYPVGEWGPTASIEWMGKDGRQWFDVCPVLH